MKRLNFFTLIGCSTILSACTTTHYMDAPAVMAASVSSPTTVAMIEPVSPPPPVSNSVEVIEIEEKSINKNFGDGSHLLSLPMTRDFILGNQATLKLEKGGNPKINIIKPMGDTFNRQQSPYIDRCGGNLKFKQIE